MAASKEKVVIRSLVTGPLQTNCYVIGCHRSREGVVIDPGVVLQSQFRQLRDLIAQTEMTILSIINTHAHADHIAGNGLLKELTGAEILIHPLDAPKLTDPRFNGSSLFGIGITSPQADRLLEDGDIVEFGGLELGVRHTPGHTAGSISLVGEGYVFTGDTLFAGSIGVVERSDGSPDPCGDYTQEVDSIKTRLLDLPDDTTVYPGHGPPTTIGREREGNPFLL
jgi:glyoxylase-like metal-dependent hydrolase (beta-lactamase superfamily II)